MIPRLLDRYVLGLWLRIFALTVLGFPIVSILINLTDSLNKLLDRGLTVRQIVVSYVYSVPENMFLVLPAAVLFATVFTVGSLARHSELTAAKAGGQSFRFGFFRFGFCQTSGANSFGFALGGTGFGFQNVSFGQAGRRCGSRPGWGARHSRRAHQR